MRTNRVTLPAGQYFVGDPCYALQGDNDDTWGDLVDQFYENENKRGGRKLVHKGQDMFWANTAYGDGTYPDQFGHKYGVDAGLIGAVPVAIASTSLDEMKRLGQVVDFAAPFVCFGKDGIIHLGHITIDTEGSTFDDDDGEDL